jgi:hypothetical protein
MAVPRHEFSVTVFSCIDFAGCGDGLGLRGGFDFLGHHYARHALISFGRTRLIGSLCDLSSELGRNIVEGDIKDVAKGMPSYADVVIGGFLVWTFYQRKMMGIDGHGAVFTRRASSGSSSAA